MKLAQVAVAALAFTIATACNTDSECDEGHFCQCDFNDRDASSTCTPFAGHGERCGGFTPCPSKCAPSARCQQKRPADFQPRVMDMPGLCCPQLDCTCPEGHRHQLDDAGCEVCACEAKPCFGAAPVTGEDRWTPITCGRGSDGCPADARCHVHPADAWAVCCPASAFPADEETAEAATTVASRVMAGGVQGVDTISPEIVEAAQCAVTQLNARSNGMYQQQLVRVTSATSQVVAGIKYTLQVAVGESSQCRNDGQARTLDECPVDGEVTAYVLSVLVQAWQEAPCELLDFTMVLDADVLDAEEGSGFDALAGSGEEPELPEEPKEPYTCIERDPMAAHEYCSFKPANWTYQPKESSPVKQDWPADAFADPAKNSYCCHYLRSGGGKKNCGKKGGSGKDGIWGMSYGRAMMLVGVVGSALVLLAFACLVHRRRRRSNQYRMVSGVQIVPVGSDSPVKASSKVSKSNPQYFENPAYSLQVGDVKTGQPSSEC